MFIVASSTISYQPTFRNEGFSKKLFELNSSSSIVNPDYTMFIPAMERRRMSEVLKMAISCSMDCIKQAKIEQPDAIIVGTSMGCCSHTKAFLDKIISANGGLISPTSFIQSTHNTIAGQISLILKNHSYNNTHTQNSLSFEHAMIDCILCANEGCINILVGAADELEHELHNMKERLKIEIAIQGYGASFFVISSDNTDEGMSIEIIDVGSFGLIEEYYHLINNFLINNNISVNDIDLILYANSNNKIFNELKMLFREHKLIDYQKYSGVYYTNSAFAMNLAIDILKKQNELETKYILVCNNLIPENLGLILLKGERK